MRIGRKSEKLFPQILNHFLEQIQLLKMASSRNEDWEEIWKAASANTFSLLEQIQLLKMASSRNEDWEETWKAASANMISLLEQIQLLKMASSRNEDWEGDIFGLPAEQPWQLEIFLLLIWPCETCARSIYPNMLRLQCNFCPGSAIVSKFPTFLGIGNPTDIVVDWPCPWFWALKI